MKVICDMVICSKRYEIVRGQSGHISMRQLGLRHLGMRVKLQVMVRFSARLGLGLISGLWLELGLVLGL